MIMIMLEVKNKNSLRIQCINCGNDYIARIKTINKNNGKNYCKKCRCNLPEFKLKVSGLVKERWTSGTYVEDVNKRRSEEHRIFLSNRTRNLWKNISRSNNRKPNI